MWACWHITRPRGRRTAVALAIASASLTFATAAGAHIEQASSACLTQAHSGTPKLAAEHCRRPLPKPSKYNTPPSRCSPSSVSASHLLCGPWNVPDDHDNAFSASKTEYGACEYWAAEERPDILRDRANRDRIPLAVGADTWIYHATEERLAINGTPEVGDVAYWSPKQAGSANGHVSYVTAVNSDGSIVITEMNYGSWAFEGDTAWLSDKRVLAGGWQGLKFIHRTFDPSERWHGGNLPDVGWVPADGKHGSGGGSGKRPPTTKPRSAHLQVVAVHRNGNQVRLIVSVVKDAQGKVSFVVVHRRAYDGQRVASHRGWWQATLHAPKGSLVIIDFAGARGWRAKSKTITV